jgi:ankyrin repeat protein
MTMRALCIATLVTFAAASGAANAAPARNAELVPAIRKGDLTRVSELLAKRAADPNRVLADGSTPLSWAVESQDPAMVRLLLGARARPNNATNAAAAPLMLACEYGNVDILTQLLDAGADVKRGRPDGVAPLSLCAGNTPADIVVRLIKGGAGIDKADETGQTALMWAAARGRLDNVRLLLAAGADVNHTTADGFTPLFFALKSGKPDVPVAVLEAGGDADHVGPEGTTAAQLAIFQKDYAFAARMVERGADVKAFDRNGHTLLLAAVGENQPMLVKVLLANGADPNTWSGPSKIQWRYEPNFMPGEYNAPSKPPLLLAAEKGSVDCIELLVSAGADPMVKMPNGTTLLHAAVSSDRVAAVAVALRLRPDPNVADALGRTPLHQILQQRHYPGNEAVEILKLLAQKGARPDIKDKAGHVPADTPEDALGNDIRPAFFAVFGIRTAAR